MNSELTLRIRWPCENSQWLGYEQRTGNSHQTLEKFALNIREFASNYGEFAQHDGEFTLYDGEFAPYDEEFAVDD